MFKVTWDFWSIWSRYSFRLVYLCNWREDIRRTVPRGRWELLHPWGPTRGPPPGRWAAAWGTWPLTCSPPPCPGRHITMSHIDHQPPTTRHTTLKVCLLSQCQLWFLKLFQHFSIWLLFTRPYLHLSHNLFVNNNSLHQHQLTAIYLPLSLLMRTAASAVLQADIVQRSPGMLWVTRFPPLPPPFMFYSLEKKQEWSTKKFSIIRHYLYLSRMWRLRSLHGNWLLSP